MRRGEVAHYSTGIVNDSQRVAGPDCSERFEVQFISMAIDYPAHTYNTKNYETTVLHVIETYAEPTGSNAAVSRVSKRQEKLIHQGHCLIFD